MIRRVSKAMPIAVLMSLTAHAGADPLEYIGKSGRGAPISQAVKAGKTIFVSGTPGYGDSGKVVAGDFPAQMKQAMDNVSAVLKASGAGWDRVVKTNVLLTRASDFADMNRIYASFFTDGKFPARTTSIVTALPSPDFLLEIECIAVLE